MAAISERKMASNNGGVKWRGMKIISQRGESENRRINGW
jgi:hypothetical protein